MTPGTAAYNVPLARRVRGPLNVDALHSAFDVLIARHEALRTRFLEVEGSPRQVVIQPVAAVVETHDLRHTDAATRDADAEQLLRAVAARPVDLTDGTHPRVVLVHLADNDAILLVVIHHIVFDGVSAVVFMRELAAAYDAAARGTASDFAPLPIQLADFATWERNVLAGDGVQRAMDFWRAEFAGAPAAVDLPMDFARPASAVGHGARFVAKFSGETRDAVRALAQAHDATLFTTLMAGFQTLLHRYSGQTDIMVGTAVAGRERPETAGIVGYLAHTLALRARFDGDPTFADLLRQVQQRTLQALEHQHVPYEALVRELRADLPAAEQALFHVVFTLQDASVTVPHLGDATFEPVSVDVGAPKFDVTVSATEMPDGIRIVVDYRRDLYTAQTIERLVTHLRELLSAAARSPGTRVSRLPMMSAAERTLVASTWNDTAAPYPAGRCTHDLISEQAALTPTAIALIGTDERLTYQEMEWRANALAARLRELGVVKGDMIGVMAERVPETVVSILAILKTGAAYVPLDPTHPAERLAYIADDTAFRFLIGRRPVHAVLGASTTVTLISPDERGVGEHELARETPKGRDIAYVIYTSGSTGKPKGVLVTHENLTVSTWARVLRYPEPVTRYLMLSSFAFDSSVAGLFWTLMQGGALVVPDEDSYMDATALCTLLREESITHLLAVPSFLHEILTAATGRDLAALRVAMTGGDYCSPELIARHFALAPNAGFYTEYGPTETTVWCSVMGIEPGAQVPSVITIGPPMPNYRMYILDAQGQPLPIGVPGEIYIGGLAVSAGYLNRPELNAELFVTDPFNPQPASRMYRSGERGRWLPNGEIQFRGRIDFQVKVRGYRVELKEVEVMLMKHASVAQAVVTMRAERGGELVAYVVPKDEPGSSPADDSTRRIHELKAHLADHLPEYMVPGTFVFLESMPVTSSGKLHRNALPAPSFSTASAYEPPVGPVEEVVASVLRQALQLERIGRATNFFEVGGHSLLVTRVVAALAKMFRIHVPIRAMFDNPCVAGLATALVERESAPGQAARIAQLVLTLQTQPSSAKTDSQPAANV